MAEEKRKDEQPNTRWWESYLVRYFLGFIVGGLCVLVIAYDLGFLSFVAEKFSTELDGKIPAAKVDWSVAFFSVALLGLGYCYLASTPITVLHAGRYGAGPLDVHSRYFWFGWALCLVFSIFIGKAATRFLLDALGVLGASLGFFICIALAIGLFRSRYSRDLFPEKIPHSPAPSDFDMDSQLRCRTSLPKSVVYSAAQSVIFICLTWFLAALICTILCAKPSLKAFYLVLFGLPVIWIGLAQYGVLYRLLFEEAWFYKFYAGLFHARRQENSRDVRDTYSHLREHSNSIFVVLVELSWLALILGISRLLPIDESTYGERSTPMMPIYALFALGIWVVPTVFMWSRANAMEKFFSERPSAFLSQPDPGARYVRVDDAGLELRTTSHKPDDEMLDP